MKLYSFTCGRPWHDGTTAIKLTQMEMMERLAALVPRPRVHLTRFHEVIGPHYKYRKQIVPKPDGLALTAVYPEADADKPSSARRISWARLLKRVFNIDISICSECRGNMRIIAAIEDPKVIKKILTHMRLPSTAPRLEPTRGPPVTDQEDFFAKEFFEN